MTSFILEYTVYKNLNEYCIQTNLEQIFSNIIIQMPYKFINYFYGHSKANW